MPELPEVETIVRSLSPRLKGLRIKSFELLFPPILRSGSISRLRYLLGKEILKVWRRGKMIIIEMEDDLCLVFHLKMTGNLFLSSSAVPYDRHVHFILSFEGQGKELRFRDVRKFGFISCLFSSDLSLSKELRDLGPEQLEMEYAHFEKLFEGKTARIKGLLLHQKFIAGIGNITSDEILFRARIHPLSRASGLNSRQKQKLWTAMQDVLREAIAKKGSSIQDFRDVDGQKGSFQDYHRVYGRKGLPCPRCDTPIRRIRLSGRSSFFCPKCQRVK